jgi:hypothetical protein
MDLDGVVADLGARGSLQIDLRGFGSARVRITGSSRHRSVITMRVGAWRPWC